MVVGGHLDLGFSRRFAGRWSRVVQSMEVIYLKMLDTNLKNTLRVVLFMNEETEIEVVLNTEN
jgi:hypothetical protein